MPDVVGFVSQDKLLPVPWQSVIPFQTKNNLDFESVSKVQASCFRCRLETSPLHITKWNWLVLIRESESKISSIANLNLIFLNCRREVDLVIGGALEGYCGYVGSGICSYGYSVDGGIYLECDMTPLEKPTEFGATVGDFSTVKKYIVVNYRTN